MREPRNVIDQRDRATMLVFFPPITGDNGAEPKEYIIGVDPAGGGSDGDYASAQVIDRGSGMQCAELQGHFAPADLAARVALIAREYNNALVAVERNNHGHAVLASLQLHEGQNNVYYQGNNAGWLTSAASRPRMLETFAATLSNAPFLFSSTRLLEECRTFVRHPDGRASAASGTHDDLVMAMAVALAVRAEIAPAARRGSSVSMGSLG